MNLALPKPSGRFSTESLSLCISTRTIGTWQKWWVLMVSSMKLPLTRRTGESHGSGRPSIILSPYPATTTQNIGCMISMPEGMILLVWRMFGIPNGFLIVNSLSFALSWKSKRWILGRVPGGYQQSPSWRSGGNWQEACFRISCTVRENVQGVLTTIRRGPVGLLYRLMSFVLAKNSPEHGIWRKINGCTLRPNTWKHSVLAAVVTSEFIVHIIKNLPCAPNDGGSINHLRVARIKINLLVIVKIDVFWLFCS